MDVLNTENSINGDAGKPTEREVVKPNEELSLSDDDLKAIVPELEQVRVKLGKALAFGMVFKAVTSWTVTKSSGEKVGVVIKQPNYVSADRIEQDILQRQEKLINIGEHRFAPTYRLPGQELFVQRLIDSRPWKEGEDDEFWDDITNNKGFSVSEFDGNVRCDRKYGPVIIDVINVNF